MKVFALTKNFFKNYLLVLLFHLFLPFFIITSLLDLASKGEHESSRSFILVFILLGWITNATGFYLDSKIESRSLMDHARRSLFKYPSLKRKYQRYLPGWPIGLSLVLLGVFELKPTILDQTERSVSILLGAFLIYKTFKKHNKLFKNK